MGQTDNRKRQRLPLPFRVYDLDGQSGRNMPKFIIAIGCYHDLPKACPTRQDPDHIARPQAQKLRCGSILTGNANSYKCNRRSTSGCS